MTFDPLDAIGGPGDVDGHYAALGVETTATTEELRRAYRTLARAWHPDRNVGVDTTARMVRLNDAAAVLLEEQSRADYDSRSAVPPLVLFASPSAIVQCSTFVGTPGRRIIEIGANRNVTAIDVSKLSGSGWTAELFAGTSDDIVVVIEITFSANSAGVVHDEIFVTAEDANLRISLDAQVDPAPAAAPPTTPPLSTARTPFSRGAAFTPTRSKSRTRLTVGAWVVAGAQLFFGYMVVPPDVIVAYLPRWSWHIAEALTGGTAMLVFVLGAIFLTRGFTRWDRQSAPVAIALLTPGIFVLFVGGALVGIFVLLLLVVTALLIFFG